MDAYDIKELVKQEILDNLRIEIKGPKSAYGNANQEVTVKLMYKKDEIDQASFSIPNTSGDQ